MFKSKVLNYKTGVLRNKSKVLNHYTGVLGARPKILNKQTLVCACKSNEMKTEVHKLAFKRTLGFQMGHFLSTKGLQKIVVLLFQTTNAKSYKVKKSSPK
jgi:hypothetical protein